MPESAPLGNHTPESDSQGQDQNADAQGQGQEKADSGSTGQAWAEVGEFAVAFVVEEEVGGLNVAVHQRVIFRKGFWKQMETNDHECPNDGTFVHYWTSLSGIASELEADGLTALKNEWTRVTPNERMKMDE